MSVIQRVGEQEVVLIDKLPAPSQEELVMLVRTLRTALLSYNLYPPGHAITRRRMGEFVQCLMTLFHGSLVLVLACKRDGFEVNDTQILQNVPEREVSRELAAFLELRGVRNVVIHNEVTLRELEDIFMRWVQKSEDSRTMQTAWQQGLNVPHIRFNMTMANRSEVILSEGLSERPVEISPQALRDALTHPHPQARSPNPDDLPVVQGITASKEKASASGWGETPSRPLQVAPSTPQRGAPVHAGPPNHGPAGTYGNTAAPRGGPNPWHHTPRPLPPQAQNNNPQSWFDENGVQAFGIPPEAKRYTGPNPSLAPPNAAAPPTAQLVSQSYAAQERAWGHAPTMPSPAAPRQRGADAFQTGQFSPHMQAQLQAQHQALYGNPNPQPTQAPANSQGRGADLFQTGQFRPFSPDPQAPAGLPPGPGHPHPNAHRTGPIPSPHHQTGPMPSPQQRTGPMTTASQTGPIPIPQPRPGSGPPPGGESVAFQPFNPFQSGQIDPPADKTAARGADAFQTGQFGSSLQAQLQAQYQAQMQAEQAAQAAQAAHQKAGPPPPVASPSSPPIPQERPTFQRITVDAQAFDQKPPPFRKLDYRQIDPISLFESRRFQEFLAHGGISHYLSIYAPPGGGIEKHIGGGVTSYLPWMGTEEARDLMKAIDSLPNPALKQGMLAQLAHTISSGTGGLVEEQMMQLGDAPLERALRKEVLAQTPPNRSGELIQRSLRRVLQSDHPSTFDRASALLQPLVEQQRKRNDWTPLVASLEQLRRLRSNPKTEPWLREKAGQLVQQLVPPRTGQQLLYQALCGEQVLREQARYGLVAMGVDAAPFFIESLRQLHRRKDLEAMLGLLHGLSQQLSPQQKRVFFGRLWAERDPLDDHQKMVLLKAMQQMSPETLEQFLLKDIHFAEEQHKEEDLISCVRHAILFHTPGLRQILLNFFRTRRFALYQEMEESILRILDKHGAVEGVNMLNDMIHNTQQHIALRASAVWLLGSLKRRETLTILTEILGARSRFLRRPKYPKELRIQAIDTLHHFQWQGIEPLLEKALKDPETEIQRYAKQMLETDRAFAIIE